VILVACVYNPSYFGGRDWADGESRPDPQKVSETNLTKKSGKGHTSVITAAQEA
jgi:hypothetical protein